MPISDSVYLERSGSSDGPGNPRPRDTIWHHNEDGKTMELVPTDLHSAVSHAGGIAMEGLN